MSQLARCRSLTAGGQRPLIFRSAAWLVVVFLVVVCLATTARGAVEWHADLDTARAAARISRRPVLAVFVANWSRDAESLESRCLGSPEAEAVMATCFEPVRVDIDTHADLTRALGVTHVPTACVLGAGDTALARFEMPDSPAAFVTTAILAAQRAGNADHEPVAENTVTPASASVAPEPAAAVLGSVLESTTARPPRGSMARVASKVRELSAFASGQNPPAAAAEPPSIARASRTVVNQSPSYASVAWPGETATTPPGGSAPAIEPAPSPLKTTAVAPWLDAPLTRQAPRAPDAAPPAASGATPAPLPAPTSPPAPPAQPGWIATLQKPFAFLGKPAFGKPAAPAKPASEPPTMPPALPRDPLAPAGTGAQETGAAAAADPYGSMPLGLEGYCPVTLVDRGAWTEGRAQWGARHRGRTYLFAGPDEQRTFLADPDRYAPALSGDDPVLALDRSSATPGQRRYGVTYQSRMYLFATPATRAAFTADPARYASRVTLAEQPGAGAGTRTY